jgi:hypothetical protein
MVVRIIPARLASRAEGAMELSGIEPLSETLVWTT